MSYGKKEEKSTSKIKKNRKCQRTNKKIKKKSKGKR